MAHYFGGTGNYLAADVDDSGNVYVTGSSCPQLHCPGPSLDYTTIKYSPSGEELWVARYDGPGHGGDYAISLAVDGSGNVYVTGMSPPSVEIYRDDYATIKYSPSGEEIWVARYDGPELVVSEDNDMIPQNYQLHEAYPNPFNPVTTLRYDLPERDDVTLTIYDILGRQVRTLVQGIEEPGYKMVIWDGTNDLGEQVSAGVYLYRIKAGDFTQTRKMVLLR